MGEQKPYKLHIENVNVKDHPLNAVSKKEGLALSLDLKRSDLHMMRLDVDDDLGEGGIFDEITFEGVPYIPGTSIKFFAHDNGDLNAVLELRACDEEAIKDATPPSPKSEQETAPKLTDMMTTDELIKELCRRTKGFALAYIPSAEKGDEEVSIVMHPSTVTAKGIVDILVSHIDSTFNALDAANDRKVMEQFGFDEDRLDDDDDEKWLPKR